MKQVYTDVYDFESRVERWVYTKKGGRTRLHYRLAGAGLCVRQAVRGAPFHCLTRRFLFP
jgi:hypothetical protein